MKYLKMSGTVILVLFSYFLVQWVVALAFGVYIALDRVISRAVLSPEALDELFEGYIIYISIISNLIALLLLWLFFLVKRYISGRKESLTSYCGFSMPPMPLLFAALTTGVSLYFMHAAVFILTDIAERFPGHDELLGPLFEQHVLVTFLGVGVIAAFTEEVVFRGIIFNRIKKDLVPAAAVFVQALVFGLMHLNILQSIYAFILGVFLGLAYFRAGSVWVPFAMHFGFNTASVAMVRGVEAEPGYAAVAAASITAPLIFVLSFRFLLKNGWSPGVDSLKRKSSEAACGGRGGYSGTGSEFTPPIKDEAR